MSACVAAACQLLKRGQLLSLFTSHHSVDMGSMIIWRLLMVMVSVHSFHCRFLITDVTSGMCSVLSVLKAAGFTSGLHSVRQMSLQCIDERWFIAMCFPDASYLLCLALTSSCFQLNGCKGN